MTTKITTSDGYTLLTPKFLHVELLEDDNGLQYFDIGATRWKIRTTVECAKAIYDQLGELLSEDE